MAFTKLQGTISVASNSYGTSTGYGVQATYLIDRMVKHGLDVAMLSNYGHEGSVGVIKTPHGKVDHYPRGFTAYSDDVLNLWHGQHKAKHPNQPDAIVTLYDQWVFNDAKVDSPVLAWTPLDHVSLPPRVAKFILKPNVTPIAMAPHGQRQLEDAGIACHYIPHAVDTRIFRPVDTIEGVPARRYLGVDDDAFLVGMVAANKANGVIHRKALAESFLAFADFKRRHEDAQLYLHMEPSNAFGGFKIVDLLRACNLSDDDVVIADSERLRVGYPQEALAGFYSAFDVLLAPSYGEGFGVPTIEAQACGTRVIGSNWAATPDLVSEDCWVVQGNPLWNEPHQAWMQVPLVGSIVAALEHAHEAPRGVSEVCVDFAQGFDVDRVWAEYWLPFLCKRFAA